jgi:ankyrin repeat protein
MPNSQLPERASLEYLKNLAKERLHELRLADPRAKLAAALLAVARDHGFSSWRSLKAEIEQRQSKLVADFFDALASGDIEVLQRWLADDPNLVRAIDPKAHHRGWTALHSAAKAGQVEVVRLLLANGADPNAREAGDNTYPLHCAAAHRHLETVRALFDAGGEVHGLGDVHELDVIGWATLFHPPGGAPGDRPEVAEFLVERGARHHIFSAMPVGNLGLIQKLVEQDPEALDRRMSRFEHRLTPLHFAISRKRYDMLDLLIELGADLEGEDQSGQTALASAMLRGDLEAMNRLHAAGAKAPTSVAPSSFRASMCKLADSVKKGVPMIMVPDVAHTLDWYVSIGFEELNRVADDGQVNFGMVSFGKAELMLNMHGKPGPHDASLWFYTDQVDNLYQLLKSRQLQIAQAALAGEPGTHEGIEFEQDIEDMFYGARQFGIRDINGYVLYFIQATDE